MRARLVRPEFWTDARVGKLPVHTRLTYIGLWNIADDAGFFKWDVEEIGAKLYGFEAASEREQAVLNDLDLLTGAGRIRLLECGVHGLIPTLKEWRIQGGTVNERTRQEHQSSCPIHTSTDKYRSVSPSESLYESVSPSLRDSQMTESDYEARDELRQKWGSQRVN